MFHVEQSDSTGHGRQDALNPDPLTLNPEPLTLNPESPIAYYCRG